MEIKSMNFVLVGVGGQGTILASDLLAELGLKLGFDVKKAEVHGMSQRGGSVISHLRWGAQVFSPIIPRGEADVLIAFEKIEAVRFLDLLKPNGLLLVNDYAIEPVTVNTSGILYPTDDYIQEALKQVTSRSFWIKGMDIAEKLGNTRTANVVLLGALSGLLDLDPDCWDDALQIRIPPKYLVLNRKAFQAGRQAIRG
jgi:indolepyruvate ferredoxin oxidoreductase beta subunit